MIQIDRTSQILFSAAHVDFRKSFDGLCGVIRNDLDADPLDGTLFVFYNRRRDRVKVLVWDSDGFWLHYKRLEKGTFEVPQIIQGQNRITMSKVELELLLNGVILKSVQWRKRYKRQNNID